jgi:hypothetical protein
MNLELFLQCQPWLRPVDPAFRHTQEKVFEGFCCFFCQLTGKYLAFGLIPEQILDQTQFHLQIHIATLNISNEKSNKYILVVFENRYSYLIDHRFVVNFVIYPSSEGTKLMPNDESTTSKLPPYVRLMLPFVSLQYYLSPSIAFNEAYQRLLKYMLSSVNVVT